MTLPHMILKLFVALTVISGAHGFKCYVCDSITGDNCDDSADNPGQLTVCPQDRQHGCFISEVIAGEGKAIVTRGCTALDQEDQYKCEVHTVGAHAYTFCNCHGEGCNKDWGTAAGPKIQCYNCNSNEENSKCDETNPGSLIECPIEARKGCYMSQASFGDDTVFERGCTEVTDPALYVCKDINRNGQELHYCNCHGDECNKSWSSAEDGATGGAATSFVPFLTLISIAVALIYMI